MTQDKEVMKEISLFEGYELLMRIDAELLREKVKEELKNDTKSE